MNVVIVESPAKAKTINKYLGSDYTVLASYGHVRDLPPKDGSVQPDDDFAMSWQVDSKSQKRLTEIANAVKEADRLILATDPDREGEAISWHVLEVLQKKRVLKDKQVERVVFNAITKKAILEAMDNPRQLDAPLGRCLSGAPRSGLSRGLHPLARALAQTAGRPVRRPRAVGCAAPDLRPGNGDRDLQAAGILVDLRQHEDAGRRHVPGRPDRF